MLTPHEFKRTRAARPRPDLGGDDLADLGPTCWYVGRFSTDKHLSIGKAHAVLPKIGLYWPPVVGPCGPPSVAVSVWLAVSLAASTGRRRGRPPWWRPSVVAGVLAGGPCRWCPSAVLAVGPWLVSVRGRGGRFRGPWRPFGRPLVHWSAVVLSWPVAARLGLVCLPCQLVAFRRRLWPVAAGVRCWSLRALCAPSAVAVAVSLAVLAGVAGVGVVAPCRGPWSVSLAASMGRRVAVLLVGVVAPCLVGPCAVSVRPCWCPPWRSLAVSVRPCWCAGVRSVAGVRFLPFSLPVAARLGRRWCWCPSLVLAARVGLVLGLADWLAVWALPVAGGGGWRCLRLRWCLPCQ